MAMEGQASEFLTVSEVHWLQRICGWNDRQE